MKNRLYTCLLAAGLALAAPLAWAQDAASAPPADSSAGAPPSDSGHKEKKTPLAKDMDKINKAFRQLRKQVKDSSQNDSSLQLVAAIHDAAVAASQETPAYTADQPADQQDKFVADFRAKIKDFIGDIDKLSAALQAGDNDTAAQLVAKLGQDERSGHKEFRKPEKKD